MKIDTSTAYRLNLKTACHSVCVFVCVCVCVFVYVYVHFLLYMNIQKVLRSCFKTMEMSLDSVSTINN